MRARIINFLKKRPANANMIAKELGVNYTSIRYHLDLLVENKMVAKSRGSSRIAIYFLTEAMKKAYPEYVGICGKLGLDECIEK